ncbi:DUF2927 domain-containing protein [Pseudooceanicola algae]|nr:DUF2927 domain-containing protein [Pseudooceanicola algae]
MVPLLALALAGCATNPEKTDMLPEAQIISLPPLPAMKMFGAASPVAPMVSNADLAEDFLDLSFQLESGRDLPVMTRFEGPIRVQAKSAGGGALPATLSRDLSALLIRMRNEAHLDIRMAREGETPNLIVQAVSGEDIRHELPDAACFVVPGISDLSEFRTARYEARTDWGRMTQRDLIALFVPADAAPQELRDCLHEEMAQALGPLNDLYRLPDSTFNDDNLHPILTGYDMLILRLTYARELHSGMTRAQVQAQLPALLARLNPAGQQIPPRHARATPRQWDAAVSRTLGPGASPAARLRSATDAVAIAEKEGWDDNRTAFSYYILGRLTQPQDPALARDLFLHAYQIYASDPVTGLQAAHVAAQLAPYHLALGEPGSVLALLGSAETEARRHQDAALLAWIEMLQAEALDLQGNGSRARSVRLDSLGWAGYGYAPDWVIWSKLQSAAALSPLYIGD